MIVYRSDHRTYECYLIAELRELRKVFANLHAGDWRVNGLKLAPNFSGSIHLQIEDILVRRPAGQENHDHRLVRQANTGLGLGLQKLWQREAAKA